MTKLIELGSVTVETKGLYATPDDVDSGQTGVPNSECAAPFCAPITYDNLELDDDGKEILC